MDELDALKQSLANFHRGNFTQCRSCVSGLLLSSSKQHGFLVDWVAENNDLAAEFQLKLTLKSDLGNYSTRFYSLLKKVQSLPPRSDCVELEWTVLYNCLQSQLAQAPPISTQHWSTCCSDSLNRVAEASGLETRQSCSSIHSLLKQLYGSHLGLPAGLVSVCLLLGVGQARTAGGELDEAILTLVSTPPSTDHTNRNCTTEKTICSQAVKICQSCPPLSVAETCDLCLTLHAAYNISDGKLPQAGELADKVSSPKYHPTSVYIKGVSQHRAGRNGDALASLQTLRGEEVEQSAPSLQARLHSLTGCCLANMGKPHTAIQHFKAALKVDFSYLVPLYYVSEQYRKLQMDTAQLEALNLLATALESAGSEGAVRPQTLEDWVLTAVLDMSDRGKRLAGIEVQALLAHTCLHSHRYEDAYERYMDLLAVTMDSQIIQTEGEVIAVPPLCEIFLGAITASLRSSRLEECVTLCDQALSSQLQELSPLTESLTDTSPITGEKRKRIASAHESCGASGLTDFTSQYLMSKAESLQLQGNLQGAVNTLESAVERLEQQVSMSADVTDRKQHPEKRQRLDSDLCKQAESGPPSPPALSLAEVYSRLGQLSSLQAKPHQAIHYYRCSLLLDKDSKSMMYHLSRELVSVGRVQEGVTGWLDTRGVSTRGDNFHLSREIQHRENMLKTMTPGKSDSNPTDRELLSHDVVVLKALLNHRQSKVWKAP